MKRFAVGLGLVSCALWSNSLGAADAPFNDYVSNGKPVEKGEPKRNEIIEPKP